MSSAAGTGGGSAGQGPALPPALRLPALLRSGGEVRERGREREGGVERERHTGTFFDAVSQRCKCVWKSNELFLHSQADG